VKHYTSRKHWAYIAMDEFRKTLAGGIPIPNPTPVPEGTKAPPTVNWPAIIFIAALAIAGAFFLLFR
jgi:hypothetical protein